MKKKWIMEAVYIVSGLLFLGICVAAGAEQGPAGEAFSEGVTPGGLTGSVTPGITPEAKPTPDGALGSVTPGMTPGAQPTPDGAAGSVTPQPAPEGTVTPAGPDVTEPPAPTVRIIKKEIKNEDYEQYENGTCAWWFLRKKDHSPSGSGEAFPIAPYSAYYRNTEAAEGDKVMYLTFDCGYENGCTPTILDTLAEENVKAMFFVTKDFVVKNPEYVKRMKEEGHLVGNHTVRHLSSPSLTPEELKEELDEVADAVAELTGYRIDPFLRPPMGEYSERTLKVTQDMGYSSIFWSIAYYDYDVDNQPGKDYVTDHFSTYHHSGAIVLMHNISESNMQALGEVIALLKAEGYRFGQVTEFIDEAAQS